MSAVLAPTVGDMAMQGKQNHTAHYSTVTLGCVGVLQGAEARKETKVKHLQHYLPVLLAYLLEVVHWCNHSLKQSVHAAAATHRV